MILLEYLLEKYKDLSRNKIKHLMAKGAVNINGVKCTRYDHPISPTDRVELIRGISSSFSRAHHNMEKFANVVYEDRWLIVAEKKPGVLSVPSGHHGFCLKTLFDEYLHRKGEKCTAHVIHRLDKTTSGLMLFAKSREIQEMFTNNWKGVIQDRRYYALCKGIPEQTDGTVESWLTEDRYYHVHSSPVDNGGKHAVTHYHLLTTYGNYSLLDVKLETGRKNQIRVHMQSIGCPIVGDSRYGDGKDNDPIRRLGLHAYKLAFIHPVTRKMMQYETPLPASFTKLLGNRKKKDKRNE